MNFENRLSHVDVRKCDLCFVNICIALSQFLLENILNKASSPLGVQKWSRYLWHYRGGI